MRKTNRPSPTSAPSKNSEPWFGPSFLAGSLEIPGAVPDSRLIAPALLPLLEKLELRLEDGLDTLGARQAQPDGLPFGLDFDAERQEGAAPRLEVHPLRDLDDAERLAGGIDGQAAEIHDKGVAVLELGLLDHRRAQQLPELLMALALRGGQGVDLADEGVFGDGDGGGNDEGDGRQERRPGFH